MSDEELGYVTKIENTKDDTGRIILRATVEFYDGNCPPLTFGTIWQKTEEMIEDLMNHVKIVGNQATEIKTLMDALEKIRVHCTDYDCRVLAARALHKGAKDSLQGESMSEFKETRPAKLPTAYPKASDLVDRLLEDVRVVFGDSHRADTKVLRDRFHTTVRSHRHQIERYGKKWKRGLSRIGTKAE